MLNCALKLIDIGYESLSELLLDTLIRHNRLSI